MNEYTFTEISVSDQPINRIDSVYDKNNNLIFYIENVDEIASFPWLVFLKADTNIILNEFISARGIKYEEIEHNVDIFSNDAYTFQMIEDSASIITNNNISEQVEWVQLPSDLSWLYNNRPYIKASDLSKIVDDIREASISGNVSSDLYSFIETHTYRVPLSDMNYSSYGEFYTNDMVKKIRTSSVDMKLGIETVNSVYDVSFDKTDNVIQLLDDEANIIELTFQKRIGDYQSLYTLTIIANSIPKFIYLGNGGVDYSENDIDNSLNITVILDKLYSNTNQLPIWCEKSSFSTKRYVPLWVLISNSGNTPAEPDISLRTDEGILTQNGTTQINSSNKIYLGSDIALTDNITNEEVYSEYHFVIQ